MLDTHARTPARRDDSLRNIHTVSSAWNETKQWRCTGLRLCVTALTYPRSLLPAHTHTAGLSVMGLVVLAGGLSEVENRGELETASAFAPCSGGAGPFAPGDCALSSAAVVSTLTMSSGDTAAMSEPWKDRASGDVGRKGNNQKSEGQRQRGDSGRVRCVGAEGGRAPTSHRAALRRRVYDGTDDHLHRLRPPDVMIRPPQLGHGPRFACRRACQCCHCYGQSIYSLQLQ